MGKGLVLAVAGVIALAWGIGSSGLPGPWIAELMERFIGGGWVT